MTQARPVFAFLSLVLAPFVGAVAVAAVGDTHRPSTLPWSDAVQIASFDPAHGPLGAVRLSIDTFVRMDLRAENLAGGPQQVSGHGLAILSVQLPNGVSIANVPFEGETLWTLGAYDGATDFAGASGRTSHTSARRNVEVLISDPAQLLYFVGLPEVGGVVELPVSAVGSTEIVGARPMLEHASIDAGVRVRVQYILDAGE